MQPNDGSRLEAICVKQFFMHGPRGNGIGITIYRSIIKSFLITRKCRRMRESATLKRLKNGVHLVSSCFFNEDHYLNEEGMKT